MPKVSIIIPNYNHARFLEQRIESILNQTYQDFEIIYLDDASTDNSDEVFAKYRNDKRIRAIYNQVNSGSPFKQWNKGIREAHGEYVWIAEADDYAGPTLLQVLAERLDENPSVGLAYCQSWVADESNNILDSYSQQTNSVSKEHWKNDYINDGKEECRQFLRLRNTIPNASAILLRRSVYEQAGCADETMRYCGDWLMWVKMLLLSDVAFVSEPLNYFRVHSGSVRNTISAIISTQEKYLVQYYIRQDMRFPARAADPTLDGIAYSWVNAVLSAPAEISLKNIHAVYKVAHNVDPFLVRRLITQTVKFSFFKFASISSIRVLRRAVKYMYSWLRTFAGLLLKKTN